MNKILIVEDEEAIANLIYMNLKNAGYFCEIAYDGQEGADKLSENHYDLCLLDIMLPKINGYELLAYAKSMEIPVIFLTAKGETADKVEGLRAGADDYITKPFEIIELLARVENVLRRFQKVKQTIEVLDLSIDVSSRTVLKQGKPVKLTYKEFDLLLLFVQNPNIALYRESIYERVWDAPYIGDQRTIDLHVQRLRRKTGLEKQIETVYKVGYRFNLK
ncbi:DNA-binding response regulator [bacterium D16-51]|nr:DNA-binding response regulator [bacterium D16-59]RKI59876.1 DNA-binding response regulator [bacterium D16-51]